VYKLCPQLMEIGDCICAQSKECEYSATILFDFDRTIQILNVKKTRIYT
jgi:hypothetical protein